MPRRPRSHLQGDLFHVVSRGNRRQAFFLGEDASADRAAFVAFQERAAARHDVTVAADCLMTNHVHLVVSGERAAVSAAVGWVLQMHAQYLNRTYDLDGHLVQGRFWSDPIHDDRHLGAVVLYVLRNPVKAGITRHAWDYPASSCRALLGLEAAPARLDVELGRRPWHGDRRELQRALTRPITELDVELARLGLYGDELDRGPDRLLRAVDRGATIADVARLLGVSAPRARLLLGKARAARPLGPSPSPAGGFEPGAVPISNPPDGEGDGGC